MSTSPAAPSQPGKPVAQAQAQSAQAQAASPEEQAEALEATFSHRFLVFNVLPSSIVSGVVHFMTILILALLWIDPQLPTTTVQISSTPTEAREEIEEIKEE